MSTGTTGTTKQVIDDGIGVNTRDITALSEAMMPAVEDCIRRTLQTPAADLAALYGWLRYQVGWATIDGRPTQARTAKGVRPRATLLAAHAFGDHPARAVPCAAAIELTHEFSLIHDDLQDGDEERRGRPALWSVIGPAQAITAGDLMWALARRLVHVTEVPPPVVLELVQRYDQACMALAHGQHLDIDFEQRSIVTPPDYRRMVEGKTGALTGLALALGARAAGASHSDADRLDRFGRHVGVAFQMRDDWLGLWGNPAATGKAVGADLRRRKKSLPVVMAMDDAKLGQAVAQLYESSTIDAYAAAGLAESMARSGLARAVEDAARSEAAAAERELENVRMSPEAKDALLQLASNAVTRIR